MSNRSPTLTARLAKTLTAALALPVLAATALPALATPIMPMRPGLWEMTSKIQSGNNQASAALAEAQKRLATMPPEQRKMLEDMMAKQGVGMNLAGDGSIKVTYCVTREMAERQEFPMGQEGKCTNTATPTANGMNVSFTCTTPPSSGTGQVTMLGDTGFNTTMTVNSMARGKSETMTVDGKGRWLGTDCGSKAPVKQSGKIAN